MLQTARIKLPAGFNPDLHTRPLAQKIRETQGEEWAITNIDLSTGYAIIQRDLDTTTTDIAGADSDGVMQVYLDRSLKTSGIPAAIGRLEVLHDGWRVTDVNLTTYRATMRRMGEETYRARETLAAALGCKTWEIDIRPENKAGYWVKLPPTYMPSKHNQKLDEAAHMIGGPGWYVTIDPATLEGHVVAGKLWTFNPAYPFPWNSKDDKTWELRLGYSLGHKDRPNQPFSIDLESSAGLMVVGTPNSGKSVAVNAMIYDAFTKGWQIAVSTTAAKSVDYTWCKPWVIDGGFGVTTPRHILAMLKIVYEEGQKRVEILHRYDKQKILELPPEVRPKPLLVVMDEVQQTFTYMEEPKSLPKDHPLRQEAIEYNTHIASIKSVLQKIAAEMRFAGIRVLLATQMAQANTGISVPLKMTLPNRLLLGANPGKTARGHAFSSPDSAPEVPDWVRDDKGASRGCGTAELEGRPSCVFKGYYEEAEVYHEHLSGLGLRESSAPEPTPAQLARYAPALSDDADDGPPQSSIEPGTPDFGEPDDPVLLGAAKAAHQLKQENQQQRTEGN